MRSPVVAGALLLIGCSGANPAESTDAGAPPQSGKTVWFAISKFQVGTTNRVTGVVDANAWKDYGYNLDARSTTNEMSATSVNSCKRAPDSPTNVLADGNEGRDNNFGKHVVSVLKSLKDNFEQDINAGVTAGAATLLLKLDNFGGRDNPSVPGELYVAAKRGSCGEGWAIDTRSLDGAKTARLKFPSGYIAAGTWVSGTGTFDLPLPWMGHLMQLPIEGATISFRPVSGDSGTIASAANPDAMIEALSPMLMQFGICPGNTAYDQFVLTVRSTVDLVSGAPNLQDTAVTCNALSLGLGFVAEPIPPVTCNVDVVEEPPGGC
jgi:hypothetical protein